MRNLTRVRYNYYTILKIKGGDKKMKRLLSIIVTLSMIFISIGLSSKSRTVFLALMAV